MRKQIRLLCMLSCMVALGHLGCSRGTDARVPAEVLAQLEVRGAGAAQARNEAITKLRGIKLPAEQWEQIWLETHSSELRAVAVESLAADPSGKATQTLVRLVRIHEIPGRLRWFFNPDYGYAKIPWSSPDALLKTLQHRQGARFDRAVSLSGGDGGVRVEPGTRMDLEQIALLREMHSKGIVSDAARAEFVLRKLGNRSPRPAGHEQPGGKPPDPGVAACHKVLDELGAEALPVLAKAALAAQADGEANRDYLLFMALRLLQKKIRGDGSATESDLRIVGAALDRVETIEWDSPSGGILHGMAGILASISGRLAGCQYTERVDVCTDKYRNWEKAAQERLAREPTPTKREGVSRNAAGLAEIRSQVVEKARLGDSRGVFQLLASPSDGKTAYQVLRDAMREDDSLRQSLARSVPGLFDLAQTSPGAALWIYELLLGIDRGPLKKGSAGAVEQRPRSVASLSTDRKALENECLAKLESSDDSDVLVACIMLHLMIMYPSEPGSIRRSSLSQDVFLDENRKLLDRFIPVLRHRSFVIREYVKAWFALVVDVPFFMRTPKEIADAIEEKTKALREYAQKTASTHVSSSEASGAVMAHDASSSAQGAGEQRQVGLVPAGTVPSRPRGIPQKPLEAKLVAALGAAFLQKDFDRLWDWMLELGPDQLDGLKRRRRPQYEAFSLQDLQPMCSWPGAHTLSRFCYELDLEHGKLKLQVDVKRRPGIVPGSTLTDYFLAYTWPVRVVEVEQKGVDGPWMKKELRMVPKLGMEQHNERFWDPEQFLNTVSPEDRRGIERVFEQFASSAEGFVDSHSKKFEFPEPRASDAERRHGSHLAAVVEEAKSLPWLPRPERPQLKPCLRITPSKIIRLAPDKVKVIAVHDSQEPSYHGDGLVPVFELESEWTLVKEDGEWKILTYMLDRWRPREDMEWFWGGKAGKGDGGARGTGDR